ncbi:hypothetical protein EV202_13126 [Bacteroides heparinolyticus]|uniref:Uncharacterized protein n=1 Tax=Prevotella heparinolytica TaxID=28113 RepID=A0A4R2LS44_9BACE|nr:hypothetical protein [Bacteroides heparinolyticus]TCO87481.1 hypothetical protein EV202_13126 [Bacteroides heparinolyticus]
MNRIKCITFDKVTQEALPEHIKEKMKADRERARHGEAFPKRVYLSLPITGRELEETKEHALKMKERLTFQGYEVVTPFEVCPDSEEPYSRLMERCIEALLDRYRYYLKGRMKERCVRPIITMFLN